ncbi:MAG: MarC family protein [Thermoplasmata archaeon]
MGVDIIFLISSFVAIFSVVNPFGSIPFFYTMTETMSREEKLKILKNSILVALAVLLIFGFGGNAIFAIFSINVYVFKIAGGLLLFKIAFDMMHGKYTRSRLSESERQEIEEKEAIGVVPLGVPLLAGPGAITTVIIYITEKSSNYYEISFVVISIFLTMLISYILLYFSDFFFKYLGKTGNQILSRILGLILAAMAVEFVVEGIKGIF